MTRAESTAGLNEEVVLKIAVCLKQVAARDAVLRLNGSSTWIREEEVSHEINEPDAYALEEALKLKDRLQGSEVVVCSVGPARVQQALKEALAKGADRAFHIDDAALEGADPFGVARALAAALAPERPDLILTGLQSDDSGFGQTGVVLAGLLGLPHATIIMEIKAGSGNLSVKRELEAGWFQWLEVPLPALLTIQSGISKLRYATLKGIMGAKSKPLRKLTLAELGLSSQDVAAKQRILKLTAPTRSAQTEFIEGTPKEIAARLAGKLKNDARLF